MRPLLAALLLLTFIAPALAAGKALAPYRGPPLPDFTLPDLAGQSHRLGDYRGQVVLVNFWATWCPPCIKEMPSMQRLKDRLEGRPFAVLAIDMGEEPAQVAAFLQRRPVDFTILLDGDGRVMQQWQVSAFPTSFVVGPDGTIRYILRGVLEWDAPEVVDTISALLP